MRKPIKKINLKSLIICASVLVSIFLIEIVCAYAFVDGFSLGTGVTSTKPVPDKIIEEYYAKGIDIDPNAVSGMLDQTEETGTKRVYGQIAYKINSEPHFKNPDANGNLMIENHADNIHLMKAIITEKKDGVDIYESGYIAPNMHIPTAPLDVSLDPGSYECTAVISAYDIETKKLIGSLKKDITVIID
ncbi:MAG: hypothetical protein RSA00_01470 [Hydrogenoanaerobacterium sp.]